METNRKPIPKKERIFKRIIGYGKLGRNAQYLLPQLVGSQYCLTELWDEGGDGYRVKSPDFASLTEDDLVIAFPTKQAVLEEITETLIGCPATIYFKSNIDYLLAELKYPLFLRFEV